MGSFSTINNSMIVDALKQLPT